MYACISVLILLQFVIFPCLNTFIYTIDFSVTAVLEQQHQAANSPINSQFPPLPELAPPDRPKRSAAGRNVQTDVVYEMEEVKLPRACPKISQKL